MRYLRAVRQPLDFAQCSPAEDGPKQDVRRFSSCISRNDLEFALTDRSRGALRSQVLLRHTCKRDWRYFPRMLKLQKHHRTPEVPHDDQVMTWYFLVNISQGAQGDSVRTACCASNSSRALPLLFGRQCPKPSATWVLRNEDLGKDPHSGLSEASLRGVVIRRSNHRYPLRRSWAAV